MRNLISLGTSPKISDTDFIAFGCVGSGNPSCGSIFMLENILRVDAWHPQPDYPHPEHSWVPSGLKLLSSHLGTLQ